MSRGAIHADSWEEDYEGGRWPGNTDGITNRPYLLVPYRFKSGAFPEIANEKVRSVMNKVSHEYMAGCIRWIDDSQDKRKSDTNPVQSLVLRFFGKFSKIIN